MFNYSFCFIIHRPEPGPEVIYLKHVERSKPHARRPEDERIYPPPHFIVPLSDVTQIENGHIHFEGRIEPVGDPSMKVNWFYNGKSIPASKILEIHYLNYLSNSLTRKYLNRFTHIRLKNKYNV